MSVSELSSPSDEDPVCEMRRMLTRRAKHTESIRRLVFLDVVHRRELLEFLACAVPHDVGPFAMAHISRDQKARV